MNFLNKKIYKVQKLKYTEQLIKFHKCPWMTALENYQIFLERMPQPYRFGKLYIKKKLVFPHLIFYLKIKKNKSVFTQIIKFK